MPLSCLTYRHLSATIVDIPHIQRKKSSNVKLHILLACFIHIIPFIIVLSIPLVLLVPRTQVYVHWSHHPKFRLITRSLHPSEVYIIRFKLTSCVNIILKEDSLETAACVSHNLYQASKYIPLQLLVIKISMGSTQRALYLSACLRLSSLILSTHFQSGYRQEEYAKESFVYASCLLVS